MDAYVYNADIYCEDCGEAIKQRISRDQLGKPDSEFDPNAIDFGDSEQWPQGPEPDGGGEADCPQHCGAGADCLNAIEIDGRWVGAFLENPLTSDGEQYVRDQASEELTGVVKLWCDHYGIQPTYKGDVTASFRWHDRDYSGVPVVNPGAWWGKTWLISIAVGYDASLFVVEADSVDSAIDEFSDSAVGHLIHVAPEDQSDYDEDSAHYDGSGRMIDLEHLGIDGREGYRIEIPFPCRYHAEGLPTAGIDPRKLELYEHAEA